MCNDQEEISLKCEDCENDDCDISRFYIPEGSEEGCVREVPFDLYIKYEHMLYEVAPFMYMGTKKEYQRNAYREIVDTLFDIYKCPISRIIPLAKRKRL